MRRLLLPVVAVALLAVVTTTSAAAATSYIGRFGGNHGAARLTYGGPDKIYVNAKNLARGTWTETLYQGTCARPTTRIVTLPPLVVGTSRAVARTNTITRSQANRARSGIVRLVRGTTIVCASFAGGAVVSPSPSRSPSPSPSSPPPSSSPSASPSANPSSSPSSSSSASSSPGGSPGGSPSGSPASSTTLPFDQDGVGNGQTPRFEAPSNWFISYIFDCQEQGGTGRFRIQIYTNGQLAATPVDASGADGSDVARIMNRPGSTWLRILTECDWAVYVDKP